MQTYMVVHNNPGIDCRIVQANWRKMAKLESAKWIRTYLNEKKGMRYCIWLSPNEEELQKIFHDMDVSYESILPVMETTPDMWGDQWQAHLAEDEFADTLGM